MKWRFLPCSLVLFVSWHQGLCAARPVESRSPEAVYYANAYADHYGVPRELVHAVITHESAWHRHALSNMGAMGLMQLMPATAEYFSVRDPTAIKDNISGGVRYLALLNRQFHGDLRMVLAAYYCGSRHIVHSGLTYHNAQVVTYVEAMHKLYQSELDLHHSERAKGNNP